MDRKGLARRRPLPRPARGSRHRRLYLVDSPAVPPPLTVEAVDVVHVVLVRVLGELDAGTAPQLDAVLRPLAARRCELDLARVSFMDTSGVTLLLAHRNRAAAAGGSLWVLDLSPAVQRILDLTETTTALLADPGPSHS
ncbi:STAS domain-containing protein [Streptomyces sp. NPDC093982]|uniref:STAS domain-containing protein n=1 Tax=Streptomyces sp. NPDC093982 TaxID=3155077 RepID=UPI00341E2C7A